MNCNERPKDSIEYIDGVVWTTRHVVVQRNLLAHAVSAGRRPISTSAKYVCDKCGNAQEYYVAGDPPRIKRCIVKMCGRPNILEILREWLSRRKVRGVGRLISVEVTMFRHEE